MSLAEAVIASVHQPLPGGGQVDQWAWMGKYQQTSAELT